MKALAVVVLAIAALGVWYVRRSPGTAAATAAAATKTSASGPGAPPPAPQRAGGPVAHATQLSPDERRHVADRIATAQAARAAGHVPAPPALPPSAPRLDPDDPEAMKTTLRAAMREVIPLLADCYDKAGSSVAPEITVQARMTLTGDPDVGTLIDTEALADPAGGPFAPGFDDCVRATLQSIELPPLAEGDSVKVTYPFVFRQN